MAKEQQAADDRIAKLEADNAAMQAQLKTLLAVVSKSEGAFTSEQIAGREWAKLSPEEKTRLELAKQYPEVAGDAKFSCVLMSEKDKIDGFALTLPARSPEEADARYRKIMGITNTTGRIEVARVQAAA